MTRFSPAMGSRRRYRGHCSLSPPTSARSQSRAIFLPGLLLAVAGWSVWALLARHRQLRAGIAGVNAAVVGILAAALYNPVWLGAVHDWADVAVAAGALLLLQTQRVPPLVVVVSCAAASIVRALA